MHKTPTDSERGRGLQIVAALSAHWRWGGRVKPGRRRRVDSIPEGQSAIVGANIRTLRQRKEWSQAKLGELMGWQSASTVCGAEGHRDGRQRFHRHGNRAASRHLRYLPRLLTTQCVNCNGQPSAGFACLACGAAPGGHV
jgi:hypothetical protein